MSAAATTDASIESPKPIRTPTKPPMTLKARVRSLATATPSDANATTIATSPSTKSGLSRGLLSNPPATPMATAFSPHATTEAIAASTANRDVLTRRG